MIDGQRLDDLLGEGFAIIVVVESVASGVLPQWETADGHVVVIPSGTLQDLLPDAGAVIVRPDRQIAAVAQDSGELLAASNDLIHRLRAG